MKARKLLSIATPLVAVSTLASCSLTGQNANTSNQTASVNPETPKEAAASTPSASAQVHSSTVSYNTPAGEDKMGISVTTDNGVITAVSIEPKAVNPVSNKIQTAFGGAVAGAVIGKDIKTLSASAIAGASLTTEAFVKYVRSF